MKNKKTGEGRPRKPRAGSKREHWERWHALALVHGFNQLALQAQTLGEKAWCRLAREEAERTYAKLGGVIKKTEDPAVLIVHCGDRSPSLRFTARDIEMMRTVVREHDESS